MAVPVFTAGQILTAALVNAWLAPRATYKTADTSRASTTTVTDDPHLTLAVDANCVYQFEFHGVYTAAQAGDLKIVFTGPAGASVVAGVWCLDSAATTNQNVAITTRSGALPSSALTVGGNDATAEAVMWRGTVTTTGTAGNFTLQWAQGTSSGTATILVTGSYLTLQRIA